MALKFKKISILIFIILFIIIFFYFFREDYKDPYEFKYNTLSYSEDRRGEYNINLKFVNSSVEVYNVNFESKSFIDEETVIYGLLFLPALLDKVPGVVFLPGGGMTKEQASVHGMILAELGYGVLVIDQRGVGETGGAYLNFDYDYQVFSQGKEPMQHLSVYDGLRAYDILREVEKIDENNIAIVGESMGGRYALIAGSIDKRLKGVLVISSSGFGIDVNPLSVGNDYMVSIDPDHYIDKISPNKLVMIHVSKDSVVPLEMAEKSFQKAKEPKKFFLIEKGCNHGYCEEMFDSLKEGLEFVFS